MKTYISQGVQVGETYVALVTLGVIGCVLDVSGASPLVGEILVAQRAVDRLPIVNFVAGHGCAMSVKAQVAKNASVVCVCLDEGVVVFALTG